MSTMSQQTEVTKEEQQNLLSDVDSDPEHYAQFELPQRELLLQWKQQIAIRAASTFVWLRRHAHDIHPRDVISSVLYSLTPSFARVSPEDHKANRRTSRYAHLDGLRGLAALFVFFFHSSYTVWPVRAGFASGEEGEYMSPLRLPIIRLLFSGDAMVAVFYVVSGFVLSVRPIKLMRQKDLTALYSVLSSSAIRRAPRLFVPCLASTFIVLIAIRLGLYEIARDMTQDRAVFRGSLEWHMYRTDTLAAQLWSWVKESFKFIHVWEWEDIYAGNTGYDVHLWTVPVEFRCSMVLFLTQMIICRASTRMRGLLLAVLIVFTATWDRWDMMAFYSGSLLAEFDLTCDERKDKETHLSSTATPRSKRIELTIKIGRLTMFGAGLWLLSLPGQNAHRTWGYMTLWKLIPPSFSQPTRFWQVVGASLTALSLNTVPGLQRTFSVLPLQYLGNISFSLYLMHGLVLHTFGYTVLPVMLDITNGDTDLGFGLGWLLNQVLVTSVAIWASDVFWRLVDVPSARLCRHFEEYITS